MAFGIIMIEVCDANQAAIPALFGLEDEYQGVSVLETSCMSECEHCATGPYVFFNGDFLAANTVDDLLRQLRTEITESLRYYETET